MEKLIIQIEASKDYFSGYAENVDGVSGGGSTIDECKKNVAEGLCLMLKNAEKSYCLPPEWLVKGNYEIEYRYDTQSILAYYEGILTKSALERITGINQKQLHHYASGMRKPRPAQRQKIETALHRLGHSLLAVKL